MVFRLRRTRAADVVDAVIVGADGLGNASIGQAEYGVHGVVVECGLGEHGAQQRGGGKQQHGCTKNGVSGACGRRKDTHAFEKHATSAPGLNSSIFQQSVPR